MCHLFLVPAALQFLEAFITAQMVGHRLDCRGHRVHPEVIPTAECACQWLVYEGKLWLFPIGFQHCQLIHTDLVRKRNIATHK